MSKRVSFVRRVGDMVCYLGLDGVIRTEYVYLI